MHLKSTAARAAALFLTGLALMVLQPSARAAQPVIGDSVSMYVGQTIVRSAPGRLQRVAVGNGGLLQVKALGSRELVLIANDVGDTSLQLWLRNGTQRSIAVHVVKGNADEEAKLVSRLLENSSSISVDSVGGNVVLTGRDLSPVDMAHVAAIKKIYPGVLDFTSANAVDMKPMVMMHVRIMEFDKNAMNQLGVQWDSVINGPSGGLIHDWGSNDVFRMPQAFQGTDLPLHVPGTPTYLGIATSITSRINLMMQTGKAWELAKPQLAARSGGVADFLVGGEVPIPLTSGLGQQSVQYKPYGIKLHIEPVVNSHGDISANLETEVSRLDPTVEVNGYPGFITRRANAEVNVHEGQTIVISGLVDARGSKTFDKVPGLGQIPILGALFRSRNFRANRTDLVIFVTPVVVDANAAENRELVQKGKRLQQDFRTTIGADIVD